MGEISVVCMMVRTGCVCVYRCVDFAGTGSELMRMDYVHNVER